MLRFFISLMIFSSASVFSKPMCDVNITRTHDVNRGFQVIEKKGGEVILENPPMRCAEVTITLSQKQKKVSSWLYDNFEAILVDGNRLQASQITFREEDIKSGYITFKPNQAKQAYVCFEESTSSISTVECLWD
ncbi:hypothetical protein [Salinivibrio costicola]|nr:hypothetical protein [Salinivibrio costicola]